MPAGAFAPAGACTRDIADPGLSGSAWICGIAGGGLAVLVLILALGLVIGGVLAAAATFFRWRRGGLGATLAATAGGGVGGGGFGRGGIGMMPTALAGGRGGCGDFGLTRGFSFAEFLGPLRVGSCVGGGFCGGALGATLMERVLCGR